MDFRWPTYIGVFCICEFQVANLNSPDKDRGVSAPSDNHRTVASDIDSSDLSSVTVAPRKQEFTGGGTPSAQATIPLNDD